MRHCREREREQPSISRWKSRNKTALLGLSRVWGTALPAHIRLGVKPLLTLGI